jgi:hypothetical protein
MKSALFVDSDDQQERSVALLWKIVWAVIGAVCLSAAKQLLG